MRRGFSAGVSASPTPGGSDEAVDWEVVGLVDVAAAPERVLGVLNARERSRIWGLWPTRIAGV
eukprot:6005366-Lingulodinium_polyedra.AAC.1